MPAPVSVDVVFDLESDPIQPLGRFVKLEEDSVMYVDSQGTSHWAPVDCVTVVTVEVVKS